MDRRKTKRFVRADVQLRVVCIAIAVAAVVLLVNFQLCLTTINEVVSRLHEGTKLALVAEELRHAAIMSAFISIGLAIPMAAAVGVLYSFKFAGPLCRFKRFFSELKTGRWDVSCKLRQGDDLQDLCEELNAALGSFQGFLRENRQALENAREILRPSAAATARSSQPGIEVTVARLDALLAVHNERFPADASPAPAPQPSQSNASPAERKPRLELQS